MYYNDYDRSWGRALKKTLYIDNVWTLSKHASWLLAFFCGFMLLSAEKAFAQVTVGSTNSATTTNSATLTFSHTPGAGANKLLMVAVGLGNTITTQGGAPPTVNSVTFNGTPMTLVESALGLETRSVVYYLLNPSNGPANVVVTASSNTTGDGDPARINASATTFINVNQTTPLGTAVKVEESGGGGTLNLIVSPTTVNDIVYSAMTVDEGGSTPTITVAGGQTTLANQSGTGFESTHSASSYEAGTGSSVTSTYTFTAQDHSGIAVLVRGIACTLPNCGTVTLVKNP